MAPKSLQTTSNPTVKGGTDPMPRPGDYQLGSLESRVAARAMLESEGSPLYIVFAGSLPDWARPYQHMTLPPSSRRIRSAGEREIRMVFTDDLANPDSDLPPSVRRKLQAAVDRAQSQERSQIQ